MIDFQMIAEKFEKVPGLVDVEAYDNGIDLNSVMDEFLSAFALEDGRVRIESSYNDPIIVNGSRAAVVREMKAIVNNW